MRRTWHSGALLFALFCGTRIVISQSRQPRAPPPPPPLGLRLKRVLYPLPPPPGMIVSSAPTAVCTPLPFDHFSAASTGY